MKSVLKVFILAVFAGHFVIAGGMPIVIGSRFESPDGRFIALLGDEDKNGLNIQIQDTQTREKLRAAVGTPLLSFRWSDNSRTIVTIEHLAGGSQTAILHFDGHQWHRFEIQPPGGESGHYEVIGQRIGAHWATITYKVTKETDNGAIVRAFICSLNVDLDTAAISAVKKHQIEIGTYKTLKFR